MNKAQLIDAVAEKTGSSKADATSRKNYEAFMEQSKSIKDPAERSRVQVAAQNRMLENGFIKNK